MSALVYLVRHAVAAPSAAGGDAARALTPEGRGQFVRLARALAGQLQVRRLLTSPYARALETAQVLGETLGVPVEEELALASGESNGGQLLRLARARGPGVALVGHNPELSEAVALAGRQAQPVPPGTIAAVELGEAGFRLAWLRSP